MPWLPHGLVERRDTVGVGHSYEGFEGLLIGSEALVPPGAAARDADHLQSPRFIRPRPTVDLDLDHDAVASEFAGKRRVIEIAVIEIRRRDHD